MKNYSDLVKTNNPGYPKTIYDDGETKLEVWKIGRISFLTLLVANDLIPEGKVVAVKRKIDGDECLILDLPGRMNPALRQALQGQRFESFSDDYEPTDKFLTISLGEELEPTIGPLLDAEGVLYNKDQYNRFLEERATEDETLRREYYRNNATRPVHPAVAILQRKLKNLQAHIEAVEVNDDEENSYDEAVEALCQGVDFLFEEINHHRQEIPTSGGTEEEEDALCAIDRRMEELDQKRRQKLDEIGYEAPED